MSKIDQEFQKLCRKIKSEGREYENKNRGVKRLQIPSYTFRHSFADGFPAITNKKLYLKGVVTELLWFLNGDTDVKYLNDHGVKIWNKDAYNWYKKSITHKAEPVSFEKFESWGRGSVGQNYSAQWRNFNGKTDQIKNLVETMEKDIMSSRLKVNAWNPSEIFETALPPCHSEFQVIGVPLTVYERFNILLQDHDRLIGEDEGPINAIAELYEKYNRVYEFNSVALSLITKVCNEQQIPEFGFELHWNQRSVDTFLGLPFNIASYGALAKFLEEITGYPALGIEGTLKCVHFYDNQYEAVDELLTRDPDTHPNCEMVIMHDDPFSSSSLDAVISSYEPSFFKLIGYSSDKAIKVDMLAPKEI